MPFLFLSVAIVAIAAFAPLQLTLSLLVTILIVILVVKIAAGRIIGEVSFGSAAKSVAWACVLPGLVLVALLGMSHGQVAVEGLPAILLLFVLFASFVMGFKMSLGATFGASATIAVISTLVSGGLLFALKPLLF